MTLRLPALSRSLIDADPAGEISAFLKSKAAAGYVLAETANGSNALLVVNGKIFCAGTFQDDRFGMLPLPSFFASLEGAREIQLCETDLPLFLCTAVLFRKAPAAQIPLQIMDSATLLAHVQQMGKDAVLVVRRGEARNLVFCREGQPTAFYAAPKETIPEGDNVADRVIEYIYADSTAAITLDLYDEVRLPPAPDAGKPVEAYTQAASADPGGEQSWLIVRLGDRVVFHFPITSDTFTVGRGGGNDLALDNLSVSRHHARVKRQGEQLLVEDLGAENGLNIGGQKVTGALLAVGDEVGVGKYTLVHHRFEPGEAPAALKPRAPAAPAVEETIAMQAHKTFGEIEHEGQRHQIRGMLFTIGKKSDTHIRIKGFFAAPLHVRIRRERDGSYRLQHVAGRQSVKINGEEVEEAALKNNDEFTIGSERFHFRLVAAR